MVRCHQPPTAASAPSARLRAQGHGVDSLDDARSGGHRVISTGVDPVGRLTDYWWSRRSDTGALWSTAVFYSHLPRWWLLVYARRLLARRPLRVVTPPLGNVEATAWLPCQRSAHAIASPQLPLPSLCRSSCDRRDLMRGLRGRMEGSSMEGGSSHFCCRVRSTFTHPLVFNFAASRTRQTSSALVTSLSDVCDHGQILHSPFLSVFFVVVEPKVHQLSSSLHLLIAA